MLVARATKTIGSARFASSLVFAPGVWMSIIDRSGLTLDTRFVPAARGPIRKGTCLYVIHRGTFELGGTSFEAPVAFLCSEEHMEGADERRTTTFRTSGSPFEAIEIHLTEADDAGAPETPAAITLDEETWALIGRTIRVSPSAASDIGHLTDAAQELLSALAARGLIAPHIVETARSPMRFEKLWRAVRPLAERFALTATMDELGAITGASSRTLDRYIRDFFKSFAMLGGGWRAGMVHVRLKLAVMFLSAEGVTVADVAKAIGYGSADAMTRAFRDAGLPAPSTLRETLLQHAA